MTAKESILAWLEWKQFNQGRSVKTVAKYQGYMDRLQQFMLAEHDVADIRIANFAQLSEFCGIHLHKEGMSPRSRHSVVAAVRGFYEWLLNNGQIGLNPADKIEYPEFGHSIPVKASLSTAEKLLMAPDLSEFLGVRNAAMMAVFIGCGVRLAGVAGLNESDLMWYQFENKNRLTIKVREKRSKERLVPAPMETMLLLHAYLGHPELQDIDRTLPSGDKVLFVSTRNRTVPLHEYRGERRRISPRSIQDMIAVYGEQQGLPANEAHPHALRHLFGTEMAENDENLAYMQGLMGHSDPKTTAIYIAMADRKMQQIVDRSNPFNNIKSPVTEMAKRLKGLE